MAFFLLHGSWVGFATHQYRAWDAMHMHGLCALHSLARLRVEMRASQSKSRINGGLGRPPVAARRVLVSPVTLSDGGRLLGMYDYSWGTMWHGLLTSLSGRHGFGRVRGRRGMAVYVRGAPYSWTWRPMMVGREGYVGYTSVRFLKSLLGSCRRRNAEASIGRLVGSRN
ncbi:hypothetical protein P154DRAFT_179580 [Amniculicola lignicola CBS 123094]|uniref:Uncharacterized protein n=1 Tax=Amniculicola lignicola CBS 123094 TaxID=1392246 RepID=A0A6A5WZJ7_9PLEO|nr:hypothetical protein P154DRAFT_179580 [Amniculicola lignicola CBS 123094]